MRHTSNKRMRAKLRALRDELRQRMHLSVAEQGAWLANVVLLAYHADPTNVGCHALRCERARKVSSPMGSSIVLKHQR